MKAWVVMPNHVHVVVYPINGFTLGEIVKSWKQFSALRAKRILGLNGKRFWQPEAYDHWIRNAGEKAKIIRYIHNNPMKAKLCASPEEWKWSSAYAGR